MDDLSWHDYGLDSQTAKFEGVSMAAMIISAVINIYRKSHYDHILKELLFHSQLRFLIPWSLTILICVLFYAIFGCTNDISVNSDFLIDYNSCVLNIISILLTTLNYSLICNTKSHLSELIMYEMIMFA
jgi:hypothetical protein